MKTVIGLAMLASLAGAAQGAVIDGNRDASYGAPLSVQNTQSSFGSDNSLAAAYGEIGGGRLDLMITGKLNNGGERLVLLFDTGSGGVNTLPNLPFAGGAGMKLDAGFNASHSVLLNASGGNFFVNYGTPGPGSEDYAGQGPNAGGALTGGQAGAPAILAARNSTGSGLPFGFGALSAGDVAAAAAYTTGVEFGIPLAWLGNPVGQIKIMAFIVGGDGTTASTQFLGGLGGGVLSGYPNINSLDLSQVPGDQFFVIPTPGSAALLALGGVFAARRRRA